MCKHLTKSTAIAAILGFSALAVSSLGRASIIASSAFDAGFDGWTSSPGSPLAFSWESSGGNPGGYIRYDDNLEGPGEAGSAVFAPAGYLGNWADADVTQLSYQMNVFSTGAVAGVGNYIVGLESPSGSALWIGPLANANVPWFQLDVPIVESDWTVSSGTWNDILSNVTELRIGMELYSSGVTAEVTGLDNVELRSARETVVPLPATLYLFALGLATLVPRRSPARLVTFANSR
jgi:hypothetical protein